MIDICIMAGNNEHKDGDLGDAESLVAPLSVVLPLSISQGGGKGLPAAWAHFDQ